MRQVSANRFSYQHFYVSRFLRTLPIYFVILAIYFTVPGFREKPEIPPAWKFLTFTQNFGLSSSAFSHAWSLCIEEQFYLACPFIVLTLWRLKRPAYTLALATLLIGLGFAYRHFAWLEFSVSAITDNKWDIYLTSIYYPTWGRIDGLAFGVGLAAVQHFSPKAWLKIADRRSLFWIFGIVGLGGSIYLFTDRLSWAATVFGYPLLALSFTFILAGVLNIKSESSVSPSLGIRKLAILSYSFYLIHKQVIHLISSYWKLGPETATQILLAGVCFAVSVAAAYLMYQLVERPFLLIRDRIAIRSD
jgi:peptidoglycan/LPS O-acetylase OafA/YrhL